MNASQTQSRTPKLIKLVLALLIVAITSYQVHYLTTIKLRNSRDFIRTLNYYILEHDDFQVYYIGHHLLNYPFHQYFVVPDLVDMFGRMQQVLGNLEYRSYAVVHQEDFNTTQQVLLVQRLHSNVEQYAWNVEDGIRVPFDWQDVGSLKEELLRSRAVEIWVEGLVIGGEEWKLMISVEPTSHASMTVQIFAHQLLSNWLENIPIFVMGVILVIYLLLQVKSQAYKPTVSLAPDFIMCFLLLYAGFVNIIGQFSPGVRVLLNGITCFVAWLWLLKFISPDDYHLAFLLRRSYLLVGKLFVSFAPLFIAFAMLAYSIFARYSFHFSTLHRTLLSIYYICYYNMIYEQFVGTQRVNPLSAIFFIVLVLLFTIFIYSGMLVSVFCSYVWHKRELRMKEDMVDNLKIQCSACDHRYRVKDGEVPDQERQHERLYSMLQIDLNKPASRKKYKETLIKRIDYLKDMAINIIEQNRKVYAHSQLNYITVKQQLQIWVERIKILEQTTKQS